MSYYVHRHVEREILSALIDGELEPDERRLVHEHLQECDQCRELLDEFGHIHGLVGELPRLVAPESFVTGVLEPVRTPVHRAAAATILGGRRRRFVVGGLAAAAIATTLAGLVTPQAGDAVPVDAFVEQHVSVHTGVEPGAQVIFAVNEP